MTTLCFPSLSIIVERGSVVHPLPAGTWNLANARARRQCSVHSRSSTSGTALVKERAAVRHLPVPRDQGWSSSCKSCAPASLYRFRYRRAFSPPHITCLPICRHTSASPRARPSVCSKGHTSHTSCLSPQLSTLQYSPRHPQPTPDAP